MSRSLKRPLIVWALGVVSAFALGTPALFACWEDCVLVAPPFCRRCVSVGDYTGTTCRNSGTCGCFYTQNTCGFAANGIQAETSLAGLGLLPEALQCPALPATDGVPLLN